MNEHSRRAFLGRGLQAGGLVGLTFRPVRGRADEPGGSAELVTKAVEFPAAPTGSRRELVRGSQGAGDHGARRDGDAPLEAA